MNKQINVNVSRSTVDAIQNKEYDFKELASLIEQNIGKTDGRFLFAFELKKDETKYKVLQFYDFKEGDSLIDCIKKYNDNEISFKELQRDKILESQGEAAIKELEDTLNGIRDIVIPHLEQLISEREESNVVHPKCKGYAYTSSGKKPVVLFGDSKEEILGKLNTWNLGRIEENKFTNCNIGTYDNDADVYGNYHRYTLDGKDISYIYLQLPHVNREKFKEITSDLKSRGAKYNVYKKAWYITPEQKDNFQDYLSHDIQNENVAEPEQVQLIDLPNFTIKPIYKIELEDGRKYYMDQTSEDMQNMDKFLSKLARFIKDSIDSEMLESDENYKKKLISELKRNHFKPTVKLVENILSYSRLVKVQSSLKELSIDYKNSEQFSGERKELIDAIGSELKQQQIVEKVTVNECMLPN